MAEDGEVVEVSAAGAAAAAAALAKKDEAESPWLHAWHDPVANVKAYTQCLRFSDLDGFGESSLLVGTVSKRLKVYRGTALVSDLTLQDVPVAICSFYTDSNTPRTPAVAVATGSYVYVYRNLRPYFKFTLPPVDICSAEKEVWTDVQAGTVDPAKAFDSLSQARDNGAVLSYLSVDFLNLEDVAAREQFLTSNRGYVPKQMTAVTCMETLCKGVEGDQAVSSLVIGTENKEILILNPAGSTTLVRCRLKDVPAFMAVSGSFDVEYRIVVACRDHKVYTVKNGEVTGFVIELESPAVGVAKVGKSIVVATMDRSIHSYHVKGKKNFSLYLPHNITCIAAMNARQARSTSGLMVGLSNGDVRIYNEKSLVSTVSIGEPVLSLQFGSYGREDNTMVVVSKTGRLSFKMLKRTAKLEGSDGPPGPPPEQDIPLNVPKKTKLYVEQTQRERDQATEMHRLFQRDLCKLRLTTARSYVKVITDGQGPLSCVSSSALRLSATVVGLGPKFNIVIQLQNGSSKSLADLTITFSFNAMLYALSKPLLTVPLLLPQLQYKIEVPVVCVDAAGGADVIKVFVATTSSCVPLISAAVNMPMSEAVVQ